MFSVHIVWPSLLNLNNLKLNKKQEAKNIFIQEKVILPLMFNPGLALTGFRTTRPWSTIFANQRWFPSREYPPVVCLLKLLQHLQTLIDFCQGNVKHGSIIDTKTKGYNVKELNREPLLCLDCLSFTVLIHIVICLVLKPNVLFNQSQKLLR